MRLEEPSHNVEGSLLAQIDLPSDSVDGHRRFWEELGRLSAERGRDLIAPAPDELLERARREIPELVGRSGRLVEIGPGGGSLLRWFGELRDADGGPRYEVHGVDISEPMAGRAREAVSGLGNVEVHVGNGYDLGRFEDGSVDLVYAVQTFRFLPKRLAVNYLREIHRVLGLGGRLWLHLPSVLREESILTLRHLSQPHFARHPFPSEFWGPFEAVAVLRACGFWIWSVSDDLVVVAGRTGRAGGDPQLGTELAGLALRDAGLAGT